MPIAFIRSTVLPSERFESFSQLEKWPHVVRTVTKGTIGFSYSCLSLGSLANMSVSGLQSLVEFKSLLLPSWRCWVGECVGF